MTKSAVCPCCKQGIAPTEVYIWTEARTVAHRGEIASLTPKEFAFFAPIHAAWPGTIDRDRIYDQVYGSRAAGELPSAKIIEVTIHHVRRKLLPLGILITCQWGGGYRLSMAEPSTNDALQRQARLERESGGRRWTEADDQQLVILWARGWRSIIDLGAALRAPYGAVQRSIERLNLDLQKPNAEASHAA